MKHIFAAAAVSAVLAVGVGAQAPSKNVLDIPVDRVVAIVGKKPILWSELQEAVNIKRAQQRIELPADPAEQLKLARQVLDEMIDSEVLLQRADKDTSITITDADVSDRIEAQIKSLRERFSTDGEFSSALKNDGFGSIDEYRRWMIDQAKRAGLQQKMVQKLRADGKVVPVPVSEEEISETFTRERERLPKRPATVTFRQIVIATRASDSARARAFRRADSIHTALVNGADFEGTAKRVSEDPSSAPQGGDLGWNRRGQMVAAFDDMMFALPAGQVSPIVGTQFGFHIIRVDRIQPAERKARHILIKPTFDSSDVERGRKLADSVMVKWKSGVAYDSLVQQYHDIASDEVRSVLEPFERAKLPAAYQAAFFGKKDGDFVDAFAIDDPARGVPKYVVAQVIHAADEGEYTIQDLRNQIRDQLAEEKAMRRLLDGLRRQTYVAVKLEETAKKGSN